MRSAAMPLSTLDIIIHPQRLRILETLFADTLTTQEIADRLPDLPKSSIYRHLKLLLAAGVVEVVETRPVKGVEEKVYQLPRQPDLSMQDLAGLSTQDHLRYFTTYVVTLLHDFSAYLVAAPAPNFLRDLAGYREVIFYASDGEFLEALQALNRALLPLVHNGPEAGRTRRKFATVTHPMRDPDSPLEPPIP